MARLIFRVCYATNWWHNTLLPPIKRIVVLFSIFIIIFSCTLTTKSPQIVPLDQCDSCDDWNYCIKDTLLFPLDSLSTPIIQYLQYYCNNRNRGCLAFLNENFNTIYLYDIETESLNNILDLKNEFGINVPVQGFLYDEDLFAYSYANNMMYQINVPKHIIERQYSIYSYQRDRDLFPAPFLQSNAPLKKMLDGKHLVCSGFIAGEVEWESDLNRPVLTIIDPDTGDYINKVNYPQLYQKGNWGGGLSFRMPYYDIAADGSILLSFAASDSLFMYDYYSDKVIKKLAKSKRVDSIKPLSRRKKYEKDSEKKWRWYLSTATYENIVYDSFRAKYYRIIKMPQKKEFDDKKGTEKPTGIIILDADFKYLGEVLLPENLSLYTTNCFVTSKGLAIQVMDLDEDYLKFYVLSFYEEK